MCTVSWTTRRGGYDLFFNRDEQATRAPETPPILSHHKAVAFLAPHDGDRRGTWLLANQHGLTVCLLNDYGAIWQPLATELPFSRGHAVLACASLDTPALAVEVVGRLPLSRTPAFHLVVLAPEEEVSVLRWNGAELLRLPQPSELPMRTSSSFATAEVIATRTRRFDTFVHNPSQPEFHELAAYHRHHEPAQGAHSVLMRRPDAATRSIIHVSVRPETVRMSYEPLRWTVDGPEILESAFTVLPRGGVTQFVG